LNPGVAAMTPSAGEVSCHTIAPIMLRIASAIVFDASAKAGGKQHGDT